MNLINNFFKSRRVCKFFDDFDKFELSYVNIEKEKSDEDDKKNFSKLAQKVADKKLILLVGYFLKYLSSVVDTKEISSRTFLSSFLIISDVESISSSPNNNNEELVKQAEIMLRNFQILKFVAKRKNNTLHFIERFLENFQEFSKTFSEWKDKDLENLLETLFTSYYQINDMLDTITDLEDDNSPYKAITKKCYEDQLQEIKKSILELDPKEGLTKLESYKSKLKKVAISNDIYTIAQKAYWDFLETELNETPTNFQTTLKLIEDVAQRLKNLTPNNEKLHLEIDDCLDIKYFKQMVDNKVFGKPELGSIVNFIFEKIRDYESPERNSETDSITKDFSEFLKKDDNEYFSLIPKFIPKLFKIAFEKIEEIEKDMTETYKKIINHEETYKN